MDIDTEYWFYVILILIGIYCFIFLGYNNQMKYFFYRSLPFAWTIRSVIAICEGLYDKYFDKDPSIIF